MQVRSNVGSNRSGSRAAATSKLECFVMIVYGWKKLTIITKHSILDVAAALEPPLLKVEICNKKNVFSPVRFFY